MREREKRECEESVKLRRDSAIDEDDIDDDKTELNEFTCKCNVSFVRWRYPS